MYLEPIFTLWGVPEVDLFATIENTKAAIFCFQAGKGIGSLGDAIPDSLGGGYFLCVSSISAPYQGDRKKPGKTEYDLGGSFLASSNLVSDPYEYLPGTEAP